MVRHGRAVCLRGWKMTLSKVFGGVLGILVLAPVSAFADRLPDSVARELKPLLDQSSTERIDPGVYELAQRNQEYSDEIACRVVKLFGLNEEVKADMVAVVDDTDQQEEVVDAVDNCQRQNTRGICVAAGTYSQKNLKKVLTPISTQLDPLIEESGEGEIVPGVYTLAGSKQNYSDEIACLLVRNFGQPGEVRSDMLAVVSDPIQQQTVLRAIRTCERDRGDSYCTAMRGVRGKAADTTFDAQRSVYSSAENPSRDVATSVTPSF